MSEKNDFLGSELKNEEKLGALTDTENNGDTVLNDTYTTENFQDEMALNPDLEQSYAKKSFVQAPVIISLVIVLLIALGFLVFKVFFDTSIVGDWTVKSTATADEVGSSDDDSIKSYYCFENNGVASVCLGSMRMVGTYSLDTSEEGTRTVTVSVPSALEGTFEYDVTGNAFTGRTLVLTDTYYGQSVELASDKRIIPEVEPFDDFKPNEKLCDKWVFNDAYYGTSAEYEFNDDGTFLFSEADSFYLEGVYTYTDDSITLKYYSTDVATTELSYEFVDSTIVINGLQYTKASQATADQS